MPLLLLRLRQQGLGQRPDGRQMTASFGIACSDEDGIAACETLVWRADRRMYEAKRQGRDAVVWPDGSCQSLKPTDATTSTAG
ncbi:hypothetical protein SDC9_193938 [bioreactor metagenome]|uniref:GGDEF domain-containing protein n=1 Tax=bioreactor metagenome TaxID=1076179 RepID=A0A645I6C4_9ZZZZ